MTFPGPEVALTWLTSVATSKTVSDDVREKIASASSEQLGLLIDLIRAVLTFRDAGDLDMMNEAIDELGVEVRGSARITVR